MGCSETAKKLVETIPTMCPTTDGKKTGDDKKKDDDKRRMMTKTLMTKRRMMTKALMTKKRRKGATMRTTTMMTLCITALLVAFSNALNPCLFYKTMINKDPSKLNAQEKIALCKRFKAVPQDKRQQLLQQLAACSETAKKLVETIPTMCPTIDGKKTGDDKNTDDDKKKDDDKNTDDKKKDDDKSTDDKKKDDDKNTDDKKTDDKKKDDSDHVPNYRWQKDG